jgi:hypothetical protein
MEFWLGIVVGWMVAAGAHAIVDLFLGRQSMPERWRREQWRDHDKP